jgi:hypothetical protein
MPRKYRNKLAKHGYTDKAIETANKITQPARRERALQNISEMSSTK